MSRRELLIFIVSGETSGDNLAGPLMAALKAETQGRIRFAGVGGPQSEKQGLTSLFPMRELSVMGFAEILPHLPRLIRRLNSAHVLSAIRAQGPISRAELAQAIGLSKPTVNEVVEGGLAGAGR